MSDTREISTGTHVRPLVPTGLDQFTEIAERLFKSQLVPQNLKNADQVFFVITMGADLGFHVTQALASITFINGKACIYGDALPAIARRAGATMKETYEGTYGDDDYKAVCEITREDGEVIKREFSIADAKRARLWDEREEIEIWNKFKKQKELGPNPSPWFTYPKRMLQMRARGFAFRDGLSDKMYGMSVREELEDLERTNALDQDVSEPGIGETIDNMGKAKPENEPEPDPDEDDIVDAEFEDVTDEDAEGIPNEKPFDEPEPEKEVDHPSSDSGEGDQVITPDMKDWLEDMAALDTVQQVKQAWEGEEPMEWVQALTEGQRAYLDTEMELHLETLEE